MKAKPNHVWLFAFADLAFLLLIAFTQVPLGVTFEEMVIPEVNPDSHYEPLNTRVQSVELRIHKVSEEEPNPFQLVLYLDNGGKSFGKRISKEELEGSLRAIAQEGKSQPFIVPDERSFTKDLVWAMSLVRMIWETGTKVTVRPVIQKDGSR